MESATTPGTRATTARMDTESSDPLVHATSKPKVDTLISEYGLCSPKTEGWNRLTDADATRFCRWDGQQPDGKKRNAPDKPAFPWDGASDSQPMTADSIINERSALLTTAFWRAITRAKMADDEAGQYAVTLADHFVNTVLYDDLAQEVELSAQYLQHYGWTLLHPVWEQRIALKRQKVSLLELQALALKMAQEDPTAPRGTDLAQLIGDPALEEGAVEFLKAIYDRYAQAQVAGAIDAEVPPIKKATLKRALKELREKQETEVPVPYLCSNAPAIYALRPWDEVFVPDETTDLQRGRIVFHREWVTEAELRARILEDGYDENWVLQAITHKGPSSGRTASMATEGSPATISKFGTPPADHIEVVHGVYRAVDDDNVPGIWCTTFHPQVKPASDGSGGQGYAKHELVTYPHGQYPYVAGKRENLCRCLTSSRGVPEIVRTWQNEAKAMADATVDWTSIGVLPPVNVYKTALDTKYKFGPAVQNLVLAGKEPKFMDVPGHGVPVVLEAQDRLDARVANYFGLASEKVSPERAQTIQGKEVMSFLLMWSQALQQIVSLAQEYMGDAEFAKVTGAPPGWLEANRDRMGILAVALHFDVRELNEELTMKRLEAVNKTVLPADVQGVISRNKWVGMQLRAINPTWAKELVMPASEASEQLFNQVKNDVAQMFLGNPPKMVENDPTAPTKLQFASQIVAANPNYQQALQAGGRFAELMQLYAQNLTFSVQQSENSQIGRIGVNPAEVQA